MAKAFRATVVAKLLAAALLVFILGGCAKKIEDIKITSVEVEKVVPHGLKSADAVLLVGIDNPMFGFSVTDIKARIYRLGQPFADVVAEPITVGGHASATYQIKGTATICEGVSIFSVLGAAGFNPSEYTVDVSARPQLRNGLGKTVTRTGLSVAELMKQ
ncbi:MAG: hypothetical protein HUJ94_02700 [Bacteroidales bacterium]|nr:hypothetical protein [Bacteroidales bacterium]